MRHRFAARSSRISWPAIALAALLAIPGAASRAIAQPGTGQVVPLSATAIPEADWIQPEALNQLLTSNPAAERPVVLQVGFRVMFNQAHVAGSQYVGPDSKPEGIRLLEAAVSSVSKDRLIVLYCGCCPWTRCPNVGPAYRRLRELGFTHVKVLYLANNFGDDWVGKGYATARGQ